MRSDKPSWLPIICLAAGLGLAAGCAATGNTGDGTPADPLVIKSENPGRISEILVEEFEAEGFQVTSPGMTRMVFEKRASGAKTLAYGDWLGGPVWARVKVAVLPAGASLYRLECKAFMVRDRSGQTEEETRASRGRYEKILKRAAQRANSG